MNENIEQRSNAASARGDGKQSGIERMGGKRLFDLALEPNLNCLQKR
jgi:hypothetical protein